MTMPQAATVLGGQYYREGGLSEAWAAVFAATAREWFIPERAWVDEADGEQAQCVALDRATDPDGWLSAVRSDRVIVTQFDDGASTWPRVGRRPSCSCSMPSLVAGMLDALDVRDGCNVLEVGTGTGWNAALLARRLGEDLVTTIEVDPTLAGQARAALASAGHAPRVITADGAAGWAPNAPYDRVIVTAAVKLGRLPYAWVRQARPGAVILAPVKTDLCAGPLVRFTVHDDGTATGSVVPSRVGFMELREQRTPDVDFRHRRWDDPHAELTHTDLMPWTTLGNEAPRWAVAVAIPGCRYELWKRTPGRNPDHGVAWLADPLTGSWASVVPGEPGRYDVRQHGPRRLWNEAEAACRWWKDIGEPSPQDWEFTITPDNQTVHPTVPSTPR
jgi:protein-L-isoaspartate(D-aspartate) O-methyltransferase